MSNPPPTPTSLFLARACVCSFCSPPSVCAISECSVADLLVGGYTHARTHARTHTHTHTGTLACTHARARTGGIFTKIPRDCVLNLWHLYVCVCVCVCVHVRVRVCVCSRARVCKNGGVVQIKHKLRTAWLDHALQQVLDIAENAMSHATEVDVARQILHVQQQLSPGLSVTGTGGHGQHAPSAYGEPSLDHLQAQPPPPYIRHPPTAEGAECAASQTHSDDQEITLHQLPRGTLDNGTVPEPMPARTHALLQRAAVHKRHVAASGTGTGTGRPPLSLVDDPIIVKMGCAAQLKRWAVCCCRYTRCVYRCVYGSFLHTPPCC